MEKSFSFNGPREQPLQPPMLSQDEVAALTHPKIQPAAQRRFLTRIGIPFLVRPDGRPLVSREALTQKMAAGNAAASSCGKPAAQVGPNRDALRAHLANRSKGSGKRRGKTS